MKKPVPTPLSQEVLAHDELDRLRQDSLDLGLAALRRRRHARYLVRTSGLAVAALALVAVVSLSLSSRPGSPAASVVLTASLPLAASAPSPYSPDSPARENAVQQNAHENASASSSLKIISDDELLALFPNQSAALVGEPGHQQLVVYEDNGTVRSL